jgi:hypothetical protein
MKEFSYPNCLKNFDNFVSAATAVSQAAGGKFTKSPKAFWASVLFTRLCTTSLSLLMMLHNNRLIKSSIDHWDFSSIATISRVLIENYFTFFLSLR